MRISSRHGAASSPRRVRLIALAGALGALLAAGAQLTATATATGTGPEPVITGIACPATTLCVAVDSHGQAIVSTDPTARASTWIARPIPGLSYLVGVTCQSSSLCVASDLNGRSAMTTEPGAASPAWHLSSPEMRGFLRQVSCPSASLCVAVGGPILSFHEGDVQVAHNPTAPQPAWTAPRSIDTTQLEGVSCPSEALCVAVDAEGRVLVSTNPGGTSPHWSAPQAVDPYPLVSISCPSLSLCVAADTGGFTVRTTDPVNPHFAWSEREPTGFTNGVGASVIDCPTTRFCIFAGGTFHTGIGVSTSQASPTPSWTPSLNTDGRLFPEGVSCASESLCVTRSGNAILTSTAPASALPGWSSPYVIDALPFGAAAVPAPPRVMGRSITFQLVCTTPVSVEVCAGKATLRASVVVRVGRHHLRRRRTVVLARRSFATTPFNEGTKAIPVTLVLSPAGRRVLARAGRLKATLAIEAFTAEERIPARKAVLGAFHVRLGHGRAKR